MLQPRQERLHPRQVFRQGQVVSWGDAQQRKEPGIQSVVIRLLARRRVKLSQHVVAGAVGTQVTTADADVVRTEDKGNWLDRVSQQALDHQVL